MPSPRTLVRSAPGAALAVAVGMVCSPALAQDHRHRGDNVSTPNENEAQEPTEISVHHFDFDLYGGGITRVGSVNVDDIKRGGGLIGVDALYFPKRWLGLGLGYERAFLGRERTQPDSASYQDVDRTLDSFWVQGRGYFWHSEKFALFGELAAGIAWQHASASGTLIGTDTGTPNASVVSSDCSESGSPGLGLRAAVGGEMGINEFIAFNLRLGVDHFRTSSSQLGTCAPGLGAATYLAGRVGLTFGTGRVKVVAASDRDKDGIIDSLDACPDQPGVANADPKKNGCPAVGDRDGDGILDDVDACIDIKGVATSDPATNGCPPDTDGDGIRDDKDACVDIKGVATNDPATNGCPPDTDGDGIRDDKDACPTIKGVATSDPATNGCPPDTDGDGIRDDVDACPDVKGLPNKDPSKNGCPLVRFTLKEIVITQQVQFDTDKAVIKPESDHLLDEVASVIKDHAEILKLEVGGHTDASGSPVHNRQLGAARAQSVLKALVKRGVNPNRLTSKGFGSDVPIADDKTEEGRAKNRRVEFKITDKKDVVAVVQETGKATPPPPPPAPKKKNK